MSVVIIDNVSPASYYYDEQVSLDGALYTLGFYWNARAAQWFVDIDDADGNAVVHGLALTAGRLPLLQSASATRPTGQFLVFDSSNQDSDPGQDDLGTRVLLAYASATDIAAAEST